MNLFWITVTTICQLEVYTTDWVYEFTSSLAVTYVRFSAHVLSPDILFRNQVQPLNMIKDFVCYRIYFIKRAKISDKYIWYTCLINKSVKQCKYRHLRLRRLLLLDIQFLILNIFKSIMQIFKITGRLIKLFLNALNYLKTKHANWFRSRLQVSHSWAVPGDS